MAVKGIERVKRNLRTKLQEIDGQRTNKAVYAILEQGASHSDLMTPIDTNTLLNSRYKPQINQQAGKTVGRVGYTAAYAGAVHGAPGKLKGQPRADFGRTGVHSEHGPRVPVAFGGGTGVGNYWDPNAEPRFLEKGFEQIKPSIPAILRAAYAR